MTKVFTLSCDDFNNKCPKAFKELSLDTDLSDVTLATEDGGQLSAHKVILAACSPLFKRLLKKNQNVHPLLYLMGVQLSQLQQLLSYIYLGQCDLTQDQLPAFMATGKQMEIEGLSGNLEEDEELEAPVDAFKVETQTLLTTNQIETRENEEEIPKTYQENDSDSKNEPNRIIALNDSINALNCQQCDYKASNKSHMRQHVQNVHKGLKYDCTNCDYKSGDKSNLNRHMNKYHLGVTYACDLCKQIFNQKNGLKRHIDIKHNGILFYCDNCQFKAATKKALKHHILVQHEGKTFDCNICQHKNNSRQGLDHHIKKIHEGLKYECHECDGLFTSIDGVKRHVNMVHKGLKYDCDMCELKLCSNSSLSTHKRRAHFKARVYGA